MYIFFIIPRSVLFKMRKVSDKGCRESQITYGIFNNLFFNRAVYEIMWTNVV